MIRTPSPWLASFTRRWHCNPHLQHTQDPVAAHSGRMGILALQLWGGACSRELLVACLCHDLGEHAVGDIPWPAKADRTLKVAADRLEEQAIAAMGLAFSLSLTDQRRLKYLDRLDAYLWAEHHRPDILTQPDWVQARQWLDNEWIDLERIVA